MGNELWVNSQTKEIMGNEDMGKFVVNKIYG